MPQRDALDVLAQILGRQPRLSDTAIVANKLTLSILPSIGASPTAGFSYGLSGNAAIRMGPADNTTLSAISVSATYTTKKQFNLLVRSQLFNAGNRAKLEGDWRYLDTNQPTYGLGPALPQDRKDLMDFKLLRFYETGYLEVVTDVLLGIGYHLDIHYDIVDQDAEQGLVTPFLQYNGGQTVTRTTSSGLSFNVLSDTRDSPINASRGHYAWASFRPFMTDLGSDDDWQSFQAELRVYPRIDRRGSILAFWMLTWFTFGEPPYLDLPATGWDYAGRMARGYPQGRIRANDLIYMETEYRRVLTRNGLLGAVAFLNLTSASDPTSGAFLRTDPGGGFGLRIKLNKRSNTNITVDFGWGAEGSFGVFLGSGEAF